jgi:flagellin
MASVINTNLASLYAQKNLSGAQNALSTSVERLSSGLRINRAKDDAAGLGISQKINSQVVSLNQGVRNANDAISMVQTAEGSLSEVSSILSRMKELSVQARNDSLSTTQRSFISDELVALKNEINAIAERTTFNDVSLLKNGLRTTVAGAATTAGQLANGAELLDGVTISNVTLKNSNVGTYTFQSSTKTTIGSYQTGSQVVATTATTSSGSTNLQISSGTITSTVSAAATGFDASVRTVDLGQLLTNLSNNNQEAFDQDVKVTLTINGNDFVAYVGSSNAGSAGTFASDLTSVLNTYYYPDATAEVSTGIITLTAASLGLAEISVKAEKIQRGDEITEISSWVERPDLSTAASARTINILDNDVIAGREFVLTVGSPDDVHTYSVVAATGDTAATIADKFEDILDLNFDTTSASGVVTTSTADSLGMSNISLKVFDTKVQSTLYAENASDGGADAGAAATEVISDRSGAAALRTITISNADAQVGNTISVTVGGKEYAVTIGQDGISSNSEAAYALATQMAEDYRYVNASTDAVTNWVSSSTNVVSISTAAELGLADIKLEVSRLSDVGTLKLTADANTGIGGTNQGIDVGTVANGASKTYDFDNLGVSFTVTNNSGSELNADDFAALSSKVSQLTVAATMNGEALFQVGAGTRDNVVIDGFKDIRITGHNQNTGADKTVFDNLASTLNTIALNTTESLSVANFATLENQIEEAITTISDFRSYLGAQQNRIEFAISNIQAQSENLTAANSRIVDTDYAAETANLTKTQIMQQAATAMLAQANQMPNVILALLK